MKYVMTQAVCPEGMEFLRKTVPEAEICIADDPDPAHYPDKMQDADALIVRIARCDGHVMENSPKLKVIGRTGVGYDTVDVATATRLGIPVVITPGANNRSVAEHAAAMMLALSKNLAEAQTELRRGNWEIRNAGKAFELEGKAVGVLGLGAIGRETAKICRGLGMKVLGYDPFLDKEKVEALGAEYYEDLEEILRKADIVTIHVPLTEETRHMIAKPQLEMMKKTALLINCSRGGMVHEGDLVQALKEGQIAGAGLDVFLKEPPEPEDPLLNCPNVLLSPHSAAQTKEAVIKMAQMCIRGCMEICEGKKWPYVADRKVYDHPRWAGKDWATNNNESSGG